MGYYQRQAKCKNRDIYLIQNLDIRSNVKEKFYENQIANKK